MKRAKTIVSYSGPAPTSLDSTDLAPLFALFKQQNEVIMEALKTTILVPESTRIRVVQPKQEVESK